MPATTDHEQRGPGAEEHDNHQIFIRNIADDTDHHARDIFGFAICGADDGKW